MSTNIEVSEQTVNASAVEPAEGGESVTWVVYRPRETGSDAHVQTGIEGWEEAPADPVELASEMLREHAAGHADWYVNVYGDDDRLLAWAEWNPMRCPHCQRRFAPSTGETIAERHREAMRAHVAQCLAAVPSVTD